MKKAAFLLLCPVLLSSRVRKPTGETAAPSTTQASTTEAIQQDTTVVVDSYTSTYAPNRLTEIKRHSEELYARDLLAQHITGGWMQ